MLGAGEHNLHLYTEYIYIYLGKKEFLKLKLSWVGKVRGEGRNKKI